MRTEFPPEALADPAMAASEAEVRKCVHCGFCLATCPTYVLLGDERDSPRGRIYLMKEMLEKQQAPTKEVVTHLDRCLTCLSCSTTCPSGVEYRRLIDHSRGYIEEHYRRPPGERLMRWMLAVVLPYPARFRWALRLANVAKPFAFLAAGSKSLRAMLELAPASLPQTVKENARGDGRRGRVAVLRGCAEPVLRPETRQATLRLLARVGYQVVDVEGEGCCGALVHHMGRERGSLTAARRNVRAWNDLIENGGLDAIVATASGCGTMLKDYGYQLRNDPDAAGAAKVSDRARDVTELLTEADVTAERNGIRIAYHAPCSLRHGQRITDAPRRLLAAAGFDVQEPAEAHLCCGSAGTYNIFQPDLATRLRDRKLANIAALEPDVIATGNIGCITQLAGGAGIPVVHPVELLDWATGGPAPGELEPVLARRASPRAGLLDES